MVPRHSQAWFGVIEFDSSRLESYNGPAVQDYELIDHTADLGISIRARCLPELFACAANALFDLTCDLESVIPRRSIHLQLENPELEGLMVAWLNELIFLHETQRLLFKSFDLIISGNYLLSAKVEGEDLDPNKHTIYRSFKAATYHQLEVLQEEGWWTARIIFDV
jgi:SHS2 domain-containing protein